jgi:hypothetical protein
MRVTSGSWDGEKVILRDQVLEVRNVDGRLHVGRKERRPDYGTRQSSPMIARASWGLTGIYNDCLCGCDLIPPAATATQRSTALRRQDPSGPALSDEG